ncbi:MAG: DsbA family protein [Actinomycetota bacterium]|nr:DsbA family protein [Actinomycetota bacterium]
MTAITPKEVVKVEFFYDPMCPFAYETSLWVKDAREHYGFEVDFRFFSLEEINREDGKKHAFERDWAYGFSLLKCAALLKASDTKSAEDFYAFIGDRIHHRGQKIHTIEDAREALAAIGGDPQIADATIGNEELTKLVMADHFFAIDKYGGFGVPTIVFNESRAIFGPVVMPAPKGSEAIELFDLAVSMAKFDSLLEIKRPQNLQQRQKVAELLDPYLKARVWRSVQNAPYSK